MVKMILLPPPEGAGSSVVLELEIQAGQSLELDLTARNCGGDQPASFEACLHTCLAVTEIRCVEILGLESTSYLDHTRGDQDFVSSEGPLRVEAQTDRTYPNHSGAVQVRDPGSARAIGVLKSGSASTVVWNPWTTQLLPDLGPDEHRRFVCVESGNIGVNRITLPPGESSCLQVQIGSKPLEQRST